MDFRAYVRAHLPPLALAREPEIVDELAQHLADLYQEARSAGLTHEAALARASSALPDAADELARDIRSAVRSLPGIIADRWSAIDETGPAAAPRLITALGDLRRDLTFAVRMLARTPGSTAVIALTMTLGIGANTVVFSAIDAILLRSAPVADPHRVVSVYTSTGTAPFQSSSYADFTDVRDSGAFDGVSAVAGITVAIDARGATEAAQGEIVSGNYFDVLGVRMAIGRPFGPHEDRRDAPERVVVLSHAYWRSRFGGDAAVAGRPVSINGQPYTIVGVAARGFLGATLGRAPDIWVPMALQPEVRPPSAGARRAIGGVRMFDVRDLRWLNMLARLRAGGTRQDAAAALDVLAGRLRDAHPSSNRDRGFAIVGLGDGPGVRAAARPLLRVLWAAVVVVLLIAGTNVASVLLARAVSRRREIAVRLAMGAGRSRLARQWLTESLLLSLLGAIGAIPVALWGTPVLHGFGIPESIPLGLNRRVLAFTAGAAVMSGILFGLAPMAQAVGRHALSALRDEGGAVATGVRATRMRSVFLVVQVALSLILLVAAGLFLRTLQNAHAVDLGYNVERILLADVNLDVRGYSQQSGQIAYTTLLDRIAAVPGVQSVAAARVSVLSGGARTVGVSLDGRPIDPDGTNGIPVRANVVTDRYLQTLGIALLRGRTFSPADQPESPRVVIVSRALAVRLWGDGDPLGRSVMVGATPAEVVGVVADSVYVSAIERNPPPILYFPLSQNYESGLTLHVRTIRDSLSVVPTLRAAVRDVDPQLVLSQPRLLDRELERSLGSERMMAMLVGAFGGLALFLSGIGLYGVMSHVATRRTAEIGIRLALGADAGSILRLIVVSGLKLVAMGVALGLIGAFASTRLLSSQLFGVSPTDPATFAGVVLLLVVVATTACAIPAWRATRVDPLTALRHT